MSFYGITDYITYIIGVIAVIILPGPNSMYCLFAASSQGVKSGYKSVAAIMIGDSILMLAAVLGAATLLKTSTNIFMIFKIIGGAYLFYLGANLLVDVYRTLKNSKKEDIEAFERNIQAMEHKELGNDKKPEKVFLKAFTLSISNPKAILFFLSFFLQFVDPSYSKPFLSFAILGTSLQIISFLYLTMLIFAGTRLVSYFKNRLYLASSGKASVGMLFIGFAVSLWRSQI